jgi:hypothetical protein
MDLGRSSLYRKILEDSMSETKSTHVPKPHTPTEDELEWFEQIFDISKDGAILAYPGTGQVYRIHKSEKLMELWLEMPLSEMPTEELRVAVAAKRADWTAKTEACMHVLGWTWVDGRNKAQA